MTGVGAVLVALAVVIIPAPIAAARAAGMGFACRADFLSVTLLTRVLRQGKKFRSLWLVAAIPPALLGPGICGGLLAVLYTARSVVAGRATERHRLRARTALLDGLDAVIAELGAGAHPAAAAGAASVECRGDAALAFAACAGRGRLGGNAAAGLRSPDSVIAVELDLLAGVWELTQRHGLALAELLMVVRSDIAARLRFREHLNAAVAGARASALVLAALPLLGVVLGELMGAAPLRLLLGRGLGQAVLVLGVGLACVGLWWIEDMVRRVLR